MSQPTSLMDLYDVLDLLRQVTTTTMNDRGLTQAEVSRRSGISPPALSRILRGTEPASIPTWQRIWDAIKGVQAEKEAAVFAAQDELAVRKMLQMGREDDE